MITIPQNASSRICRCSACSDDPAPTYSEAHRRACEVRYVAAMATKSDRSWYLFGKGGVAERRGRQACERIIDGLKLLAVDKLPSFEPEPVDKQPELFA